MIAGLAHDLRTPIAIIRAQTEMALLSPNVTDEVQMTLRSTIEEIDRMAASITHMLRQMQHDHAL